jgi:hypothetical protein
VAYLALWLIVPFRHGDEPPFARAAQLGRRVAAEVRDAFGPRRSGPRPNGHAGDHDVPTTGVPC